MVKIRGLREYNAKLKRLRTATQEPSRKGVAEGASMIVAEQKRLAPVKTGALRESISWTFGSPPAYAGFQGTRKPAQPNETRATIYAGNSAVRYGHLVEFGTVDTRAQPFFFPGYRIMRKRAKAAIQRAVKAAVQTAAR